MLIIVDNTNISENDTLEGDQLEQIQVKLKTKVLEIIAEMQLTSEQLKVNYK